MSSPDEKADSARSNEKPSPVAAQSQAPAASEAPAIPTEPLLEDGEIEPVSVPYHLTNPNQQFD